MLNVLAFIATLAVGLLVGFRLGRAHLASQTSGCAAPITNPDLKALQMALTTAAQTIVDNAGKLPDAIDAYTTRKIDEAEKAKDAQHTEDLDGISAALQPTSDKVATPAAEATPATTFADPYAPAA